VNAKQIALGVASVGLLAAFGILKWKILSGNGKWWAIAVGGILFAVTTPAIATGGEAPQQ
jgi:hypothetical protein